MECGPGLSDEYKRSTDEEVLTTYLIYNGKKATLAFEQPFV